MKKFFILPLLLLGFATVSLQAGQEVYKQVAPPPPPMYDSAFTVQSTWGRTCIKTAAALELFRTMIRIRLFLETASKLTRRMTSVSLAALNSVTSLARA